MLAGDSAGQQGRCTPKGTVTQVPGGPAGPGDASSWSLPPCLGAGSSCPAFRPTGSLSSEPREHSSEAAACAQSMGGCTHTPGAHTHEGPAPPSAPGPSWQPLPLRLQMGPLAAGHRGTVTLVEALHPIPHPILPSPQRRCGGKAGAGVPSWTSRGAQTKGCSYRTWCSCGRQLGSPGTWASRPGVQARCPGWGGRDPAGCPHPQGSRQHWHSVLALEGGGGSLGRHAGPGRLRKGWSRPSENISGSGP